MSAHRQDNIIPGQHGRPGVRRSTRYSLDASPPPELVPVLKGLIKESPRRGFTSKGAIMGAMAAAARRYRQKGKCDDLLRLLRDHGIVLSDVEISGKRFYVDQDAAELMIVALEEHLPHPMPTVTEMSTRLRQLIELSKRPLKIAPVVVPASPRVDLKDSVLGSLAGIAIDLKVLILEEPEVSTELLTEVQLQAYKQRLVEARRRINDELNRLADYERQCQRAARQAA